MNRIVAWIVCAMATASATAGTLKAVPTALNPAKAYILVEYRLMENPMAGFPGSSKYVPLVSGLVFARYDPALKDIRGAGKAAANPVPKGQASGEPFRARVLAKTETGRMLLLEVEPDTWVVQGWANTSFSLGSYAFKLQPGTVTDIGVATAAQDWGEGDRAATAGDMFKMALLGPFAKRPAIAPMRVEFRPRTAGDMPLPDGLAASAVQPVQFMPNATFGNYLGGPVNRIEGVDALAKARAGTDAK